MKKKLYILLFIFIIVLLAVLYFVFYENKKYLNLGEPALKYTYGIVSIVSDDYIELKNLEQSLQLYITKDVKIIKETDQVKNTDIFEKELLKYRNNNSSRLKLNTPTWYITKNVSFDMLELNDAVEVLYYLNNEKFYVSEILIRASDFWELSEKNQIEAEELDLKDIGIIKTIDNNIITIASELITNSNNKNVEYVVDENAVIEKKTKYTETELTELIKKSHNDKTIDLNWYYYENIDLDSLVIGDRIDISGSIFRDVITIDKILLVK